MAFSGMVYALDAGAKRRLKLAGVAVPIAAPAGRNPTPRELKQLLGALTDYQVNISAPSSPHPNMPWHAQIWHAQRPALQPWAFVAVDQYRGEDVPQAFRFVRGTPDFMVQIVQILAVQLGPLVLQPDGSQPPLVVHGEFDASAYVESWRNREPLSVKSPRLAASLKPGEVDLNSGMIEAVLQPAPGYVCKHHIDRGDVEGRLARTQWFANCGRCCSVDLSVIIEQVESWERAIESCSSAGWEEVELAAQNQLTVFLFRNDHENYQNWNRFASDRKQAILEPLLRERIEPFQASQNLPVAFLHCVQWDLLGALMEDTYSGCGYDGLFFSELLMVYESGHFPCGWLGRWPQGKLLVY